MKIVQTLSLVEPQESRADGAFEPIEVELLAVDEASAMFTCCAPFTSVGATSPAELDRFMARDQNGASKPASRR